MRMKSNVTAFGVCTCLVLGGLAAAWQSSEERESGFRGRPGFRVETYYPPASSGSVVSLGFDSQGRLAFSREKGPVVILIDENGDGRPDGEKIFTDKVVNCQGLQFDGSVLYAVGEGPRGVGLYRVTDQNGDDQGDQIELLGLFSDPMAEHGPHAVMFGPDGYLYLVLGNHTGIVRTPAPDSPHRDFKENNLLPTYTDPRGHARNIRAPGGIIFRLRAEAPDSDWELVAGGFRNEYDAAFNLMGELFTLDSDMEWDINLPWYRPVRTNHIVPGAEFGWRTGSGKWPEYYPDSLPAMTDVGRGSPAGVVFYQHVAYPQEYHDTFLQGDWSRGRILIGFLTRSGATYSERSEDFVLGEPLNVTDVDVGPDGWVYFSKGGRSTEGGVYRVVYENPPPRPAQPRHPVEQALSQPQPRSAFSRAVIRDIARRRGSGWEKDLLKVIQDGGTDPARRVRALEFLQVYGSAPGEKLLISLGKEKDWEVRAASTYYLGMRSSAGARAELVQRLADSDPFVRRRACEALIRTGIRPDTDLSFSPTASLLPLLEDGDRFVRYAARELLERVNRNLWRDAALQLNSYPAATEGLLALIHTAGGTRDLPVLLQRELELLKAGPSDGDLLGLLRVIHLTMIADAGVDYSKIYQAMGEILLPRFPSSDQRLDRELALTLAHLETPGTVAKLIGALQSPGLSREQQIHYAYCLRTMQSGWEPESQRKMIAWFQKTQEERWKGGASFLGFIENMWNDFLRTLPEEEKQLAMKQVPTLSPLGLGAAAEQAATPAFRRAAYNQVLSELELEEYLLWDPMAYTGDPEKGRQAFDKAFCSACHRFGSHGQEAGPDLTDVGRRFPRKDLIEAILYPSRTISDLWSSVEVATRDNQTVSGVIVREDAGSLTVRTAAGHPVEIPKDRILSRSASKASMMPDGLLNNLDLRETIDLFAFLEKGH